MNCQCNRLMEKFSGGDTQIWTCLGCGRVCLVLNDGDTLMWLLTETAVELMISRNPPGKHEHTGLQRF